MRIAHTKPAPWPTPRPGRFVANVRTHSPVGCQVALLGLPDDTGVRLNFGRPGAKAGPSAFRTALSGFGMSFDTLRRQGLRTLVFDAGDVEPAEGNDEDALLETHRRVEAAARELHERGLVVVGIGGGQDLSLATIAAYSKHAGGRALGGINLDAHMDVRDRAGSGMPFRRLIELGAVDARSFVELGLGRFSNERDDFDWLQQRGSELVFADTMLAEGFRSEAYFNRALASGSGFMSIDLDVIDAAYAPGVSAPNPLGLSVRHVAELAETAGLRREVRHFDLMELCPPHDVEERTARAAAYLFLAFMTGYAQRPT